MLCEHLYPLEQAMLARGMHQTYRGQPWGLNCREWVYFDCYIDQPAVRQAIPLPTCVVDHSHRGTHDGSERGFVCNTCNDGIIGNYEKLPGKPVFEG